MRVSNHVNCIINRRSRALCRASAMPGKTSQSGSRKQDSAKDKLIPENDGSKKITIWPEWSDAAIQTEKWDLGAHAGGGAKGREKKGAQTQVAHFEDPEKVLLPSSLADPSTVLWKIPTDPAVADVFDKGTPAIVSNPESNHFDLNVSNTHLFGNQLMCWIIGQINMVWQMRHVIGGYMDGQGEGDKETSAWTPWEHIQPHIKGTPALGINPSGKYYVRLYWMGCWRKITVDDRLPYLEQKVPPSLESEKLESIASVAVKLQQEPETILIPLYPRTDNPVEIWPALIFKAILKIVSLDYCGGGINNDYGENNVIAMLTRWPHFTLHTEYDLEASWATLEECLPMWVCDWDNNLEHEKTEVEKESESGTTSAIVVGNFSSCYPHYDVNPIPQSLKQRSKTSETHLKTCNVLPSDYDLSSNPQMPILVTQLRNKDLYPPPLIPPLPEIQVPHYLGLTEREPDPNCATPSPALPKLPKRFVEVGPSVQVREAIPLLKYTRSKSDACSVREDNISAAGTPTSASPSKKSLKGISKKLLSFIGTEGLENTKSVSTNSIQKEWMDYSDFFSTFDLLQIYQNPQNFKHRGTYFDLSNTQENVPLPPTTKKGGPSNLACASKTLCPPPKENNYLLIDSDEPVELILVFSSISNWKDGDKDTHLYTSMKFVPALGSLAPTKAANSPNSGNLSPDFSTVGDQKKHSEQVLEGNKKGVVEEPGKLIGAAIKSDSSLHASDAEKKIMIPGTLILLAHSWRTVKFGDPVLTISTTGTKGTVLMLPPGRHVFRLYGESPIAFHLEVFSDKPFTLTDEDSMFTWLSQDCCRFVRFSSRIINHFFKSSRHFNDANSLEENLREMVELFVEAKLNSDHVKILLASALHTWTVINSNKQLTDKMQRAWKAFFLKIFDIIKEGFLPQASVRVHGMETYENKLKILFSRQDTPNQTATPEMWKDRQATIAENKAAKVITQAIRCQGQKYLEQCTTYGSQANKDTVAQLEQSLPMLEPLKEKLGVMFLRDAMKLDPSIAENVLFTNDLFSTVYSSVYAGPFPALSSNSWTIILRKTIFIHEEQFMAFQFRCPLQSSLLRVIDNDTMSEMPRTFHLTIPTTYQPNKRGYTLQAEAWVPGVLMPGDEGEEKKWRLRIMTSSREKPPILEKWNTEETKDVEESFHKEELMDYCLPNREQVLFRYLLLPTADCGISIQATASKQDALFKLEILDNDQVVVSTEGRGTCTIPLHYLQHSPGSDTSNQEDGSHKYVVQGQVLMNSWPVEETAWYQIASIKSSEQLEESSTSTNKPNSGKKSKAKKKPPSSQAAPPTPSATPQQLDTSKAHWILRVVTKESEGQVKVEKDTEREDKLKSMVQAWEAEQPGRTKKAQESRRKFLEARAIQEDNPSQKQGSATDVQAKQADVPKPNTGPVKIWQMDLTPFYINSGENPKLLDDKEKQLRLEKRQRKIKEYRLERQEMLQVRNQDREARNLAKVKQLEMAAEWQEDTNHRRNGLNEIRENIREKLLAIEKVKAEKEAELLAAQEGGRESKTAKGKGKKKK